MELDLLYFIRVVRIPSLPGPLLFVRCDLLSDECGRCYVIRKENSLAGYVEWQAFTLTWR